MPNYIVIPAILIFLSFSGGLITGDGMSWYDSLILPEITPEGGFIGAVWTFLYLLIAISILIAWNTFNRDRLFYRIMILFGVNLVLNFLWSYLFFGQNLIFEAFIEMFVLNLTTLILFFLIWSKSKLASALLIPYFLWVSFATYLTYQILILNS